MMFNVGDRVRCIREAENGVLYGRVGETYTVIETMLNDLFMFNNEIGWCDPHRFELVDQPERQELTFYALIGKNPRGDIFMLSYSTEREAIAVKGTYEEMAGYNVVAMKKIKVRV